jgi:hypothetical protein
MLYSVAADLLVFIHLAFVAFVGLGGLLVLKWRWLGVLHLPAVIWGALIEFQGWLCPLTPWEQQLRLMAGQASYTGSFIQHYFQPLLYPSLLTRDIQLLLGSGVIVINIAIYGWLLLRWWQQCNSA